MKQLMMGWVILNLLGVGWLAVDAAELVIRVENPPPTGQVTVMIFDSPNTFVDLRDPVRVIKQNIADGSEFHVKDLADGEYAVVAYHDENEDDRLNENFIGIPREPLGFSNRYWPQGPPTFARAAFSLAEDESRDIDVELKSVFGKIGLIGLGVGAIVQTSPYRDASSTKVQPIPAITYIGDRLQVFGPSVQWGIFNAKSISLAARFSYRFGAYDEDDSAYLKGMGDRDDTLMGGLAIQISLPDGFDLGLGYEHDVLNTFGGGEGQMGLGKSFQRGAWTFTPQAGIRWLSSSLADYDYGVPASRSTVDRPAYKAGSAVLPELGFGIFYEWRNDWRFIISSTWSFLPSELTDSPLVEDDDIIGSFIAINRLF